MTAPECLRPLRLAALGGLVAATLLATACGGPPAAPAAGSAAPATTEAPLAADEALAAPPAGVAAEAPATPDSTAASAPASNPTPTESAGGEPPAANLGKDIVLADASTPATAGRFREGPHYSRLPAAQGTSSPAGTVEVAEVFWYGCPHCYDLEPQLKDWARRQPADVKVVKIPVMWQQPHEIHARLFYTAEALGKLDQIGPEVFRAFHQQNRQLLDEGEIRSFFGQFGVSAQEFDSTWKSFGVEQSLRRAKDFTARYKVRGVPLLVVNGKYLVNGPEIRSHKESLEVIDELVARERNGG